MWKNYARKQNKIKFLLCYSQTGDKHYKHGTAVKAVEEQKKSGWIKNDQLWIKTLYIGLTVYYSSDTWLLQLD